MIHNTILYITPALVVGGAEKFLISLSNSLTNDNKKQILVSLSNKNPLLGEFNKDISFHSFPRSYKFDPRALFRLRKLVKTTEPDIVVCLNFFSYIFFRVAIIGLKRQSNRIISYHSTIHLTRKENLLHNLYARILNSHDLIITVSKNQAVYTSRQYHIPMNYFKTIYNGVDTTHWTLPPADWQKVQLRANFGIPSDAKVIIIAATFRIEKNHVGAIKSLSLLHKNYSKNVYLMLVGNGATMNDTVKAVDELNMKEFVKFAGTQNDVRPFYWSSDLFTLCSDSETFSIAALEAMACGLPCVLTDVGGASEMIVEGVNGFLCKPEEQDIADTWQKALEFTFSSEKIEAHIHEHFHKEKMVEAYKETFQDAITNFPVLNSSVK